MGNQCVFEFNFDLRVLEKLREAMNENSFFAINQEREYANKHKYFAWGHICAAMDRVHDTMEHINTLKLGEKDGIAFDFYELINDMFIVISNIQAIATIFNMDYKNIEECHQSFNLQWSDDKWFRYVRSLCVHPTETDHRHHKIIMSKVVLDCCARVIWDSPHKFGQGDLVAIIYSYPQNDHREKYTLDYEPKYIPIYVSQFVNYLQRWLDFVPNITDRIYKTNEKKTSQLKRTPIKKLEDCNNDIERLVILQKEYNLRFGDDYDDLFDFYIMVFSYHLSNETNMQYLEKYKNAIRLSMGFFHNALQNMSFCGYENTGVKDEHFNDLFREICYPSIYNISDLRGYGYNLSKLYLLNSGSSFERVTIDNLLEEVKPIANKYVFFTNCELAEEKLILMQMVIYFAALECNSILNKNIPNDIKYRTRLLTLDEEKKLFENDESDIKNSFEDSLPEELRYLFE